MKIGLYDVDSVIPNLALMKLSAHHKSLGDQVEWYSPLFHSSYDKIYASKIFTFTKNGYLRKDIIIGGSGYDLTRELPYKIEHLYPDYELYNCNYAIGFITRGCIRKCEFCIVPKKEGKIRKNANLEEFCKDQENVMLLDNNILAHKNHLEELENLRDSGKKIDFNQGLDIRLITKENAKLLKEIKNETIHGRKQIRFSLDNHNLIPIVRKKMQILKEAGITLSSLYFYVLIGHNTTLEEDLKRVEFLREYKCTIYPMPFVRNKQNMAFKRWVCGFYYAYISFEDYQKGIRKGEKK